MDLQNGVGPLLEQWAYYGIAPDFDILEGVEEEQVVGRYIRQLAEQLGDYCQENNIPYSMIFSASGRANGKEQRYISNTYLQPEGRVTPEVLLCGLIATNGINGAATSVGHVTAAYAARQFFLNKLEEELAKLQAPKDE